MIQDDVIKITEDVGSRIRKERLRLKMTQEDLEEKSGISSRQISDIENGSVDTKLTTLFKIASAFGLTLYDLFYIEEKL